MLTVKKDGEIIRFYMFRKGLGQMRAEYINPFLESARHVIEQVIQVRPQTGKLVMRDVTFLENYIWIRIGVSGQMEGDILFGLHEAVALRVVSAMMGGFVLTEFDDLG